MRVQDVDHSQMMVDGRPLNLRIRINHSVEGQDHVSVWNGIYLNPIESVPVSRRGVLCVMYGYDPQVETSNP